MLRTCSGPHFGEDCVLVYVWQWSGIARCPVCSAEERLVEPAPLAERLRRVLPLVADEAQAELEDVVATLESRG